MIEEQFMTIYNNDPQLREVLQENIEKFSIQEKYQILTAYINGGGVQGLIEQEEAPAGDDSVIVHEGKSYKRIQIEGEEEDYLMDEEGNIYDTNLQFVGQAGGDDAEE